MHCIAININDNVDIFQISLFCRVCRYKCILCEKIVEFLYVNVSIVYRLCVIVTYLCACSLLIIITRRKVLF